MLTAEVTRQISLVIYGNHRMRGTMIDEILCSADLVWFCDPRDHRLPITVYMKITRMSCPLPIRADSAATTEQHAVVSDGFYCIALRRCVAASQ
jgi:hypothetical protein